MNQYLSYDTITTFNADLRHHSIASLPEAITIEDVTYFFKEESNPSFFQLSQNPTQKYLVVYQTRTKDKHANFNRLVLAWNMDRLTVSPIEARLATSRAQVVQQLHRESADISASVEMNKSDTTQSSYDNRIVGATVDIIIEGLNQGQSISAKVDTGATYSSIDAQQVSVADDVYGNGKVASFVFRERRYRVPVTTFHAIRTADGGVENRPVVMFSVAIKDQTFPEIEFNLNDRAGMEYDVLVGLNLLTKGDFLIDPKVESISAEEWDPDISSEEWAEYDTLFEDVKIELVDPLQGLDEIVETIKRYPNIRLKDVLGKMKSDAMVTLENVAY